ncbi:hypothetical protein HRW18_16070 [Streptomyces lunaelactis]|nr:hypothetical protein [Streptomyces lunaelactis]NUK09493.1 hypothetical protein [Streptomyces lunaelactis]NUK73370.1 hypothetical protein [Streptomyces lunaelactis]NUL10923.1 hypothetical protein [Streptomyces lunaelactis]NUL24515.1 hypothetical protein [Streptomyces lunaelactis]
MTRDIEHDEARRERRLSIGQAVVDALAVIPAVVKVIDWLVSILDWM